MNDLEEDKEYRQNVNIYKKTEVVSESTEEDDEHVPRISLEEMLEDLVIDDGNDVEMM